MKRLRGNTHIVSYIDSHASRLNTPTPDQVQQYEVLLLMEYCLGKGLIDFMNTRLTHRLTEPEILSIMVQITTGVAMCHHLHPPLIHRDIKIENVLIDGNGTYKLCDFGSAVDYSGVPKTSQELQLLHNDIMQHTTPQYRAPEMIDLSRGFPIDDKLDVWALGVFLYKICYYTTPFELPKQRTLQDLEQLILHSATTLHFPSMPQFSPRLQNIIRCCLREDPRRRPNGLQLLQEVCLMLGIKQIPDVVPYSVRLHKLLSTAHNQPQTQHQAVTNTNSNGLQTTQETAQKVTLSLKASNAPKDVFASIDKSKLLSLGDKPKPKPRPKSAIYHSAADIKNSDSTASLKNLIDQHVTESNNGLSNMRKSEDLDRGTLDFLKSKDETGIYQSQNTGGSFKSTIKNGLRRISTGGSIGAQRSGSINYKKRISAIFTGLKNNSEENLRIPSIEEPKGNSIQRRIALLKSSDKKPTKTASGYGKYTEADDLHAINRTNLSANASSESLSSYEVQSPTHYEFSDKTGGSSQIQLKKKLASPPTITVEKSKSVASSLKPTKYGSLSRKYDTPPPCPPSLSHNSASKGHVTSSAKASSPAHKKPPPKPKKPLHLKTHEIEDKRRLSTSSDVSMPDLDDLEQQFARRFPSYV